MRGAPSRFGSSLILFSALAISACGSDELSSPPQLEPEFNTQQLASVRLVKNGPEGTTATFRIEATGGSLPAGDVITLNACPRDPNVICGEGTVVWVPTNDDVATITITEIATSAGIVFEQMAANRTMDGITTDWGVFAPDAPTTTFQMNGTAIARVLFKNVGTPEPKLRIEKTAANATVNAGSPMAFNITTYSDGPGTATNVTLTDLLPGGQGISWSTVTAGCTVNGTAPAQTLNCSFGDLAAGQTRTVSVSTATTGAECREYPNTAVVQAANHPPVSSSATATMVNCPRPAAVFLIIDEDGIDNGDRWWYNNATSFGPSTIKKWSTNEVNDDMPGLAQRSQLRWFAENVGNTYWFFTGQVGDEGWFAPKVIPASWAAAGPTTNGLQNFLGVGNAVGNGLGTGSDPESRLDKIPYVTPLRAEGLHALIGKTVCALVWDSDISINYGPLNGSLKGEKLGIVAFEVHNVVYLSGFSSSTLPRVQLTIRDANQVCQNVTPWNDAPEPSASSSPTDIRPNYTADNNGYVLHNGSIFVPRWPL
jgi:uncharacterized repeat protein (TIGR01451 family)